MGVSSNAKRAVRAGYLKGEDIDRPPASGCDSWLEKQSNQRT